MWRRKWVGSFILIPRTNFASRIWEICIYYSSEQYLRNQQDILVTLLCINESHTTNHRSDLCPEISMLLSDPHLSIITFQPLSSPWDQRTHLLLHSLLSLSMKRRVVLSALNSCEIKPTHLCISPLLISAPLLPNFWYHSTLKLTVNHPHNPIHI